MSKHVFKTKKLTIDGKKIRQVVVSMGKSSKKTILVLDNFFGLDEETPQNTFANLCYEVCSTLKSGHTFVYSETTGLDGTGVRNLIEKVEPDGIMFASSVPFNRVGLDTLQYFQHVRKFDGVPAILTTPFSKWTGSGGFEKGEAGKNLIGFNLKDLLAVTEGKNPYTPITKDDLKYPIRFIKTREQFDKFINKLESKKLVCIDTEAANLNKIVNTVFTIQFGFRTKKGIETYILPWKHKDFTWDKSDFIHVKKTLKSYFMKTKAELLFHFAPYDVGQLCVILDLPFFPADTYDTVAGNFAMDENHKYLDNMFNIDGNKYSPYSLSHIEAKFGIFRPDDILGKDDRKNMSRFTLEEVGTYGAFDVVSPILIRERQIEMATSKYIGYKSVDAYKKLVIHQLGIMVKTFAFLHNTGIHIDQDNANKLVKKDSVFNTVIEKIKKDLLATKNGKRANEILLKKQGMTSAGGMFSSTKAEIFSLTKPAHLRTLFFEVMKLKPIRTGKNGDPSTDKAFQKAYKHLEEVKLFGQFNKVKTLKSNFADSIIKLAKSDPDFINDGRLRPFFGFVKVLPGRISVNRPNCVTPDSLVLTKRGNIRIDNVVVGDEVWTHSQRWRNVLETFNRGESDCLKITFSNGESIRCSYNHYLLTSNGWKKSKRLRIGEELGCIERLGEEQEKYKAGTTFVPPGIQSDEREDREVFGCKLSKHNSHSKEQYAGERVSSKKEASVRTIENRRQESTEGKVRETLEEFQGGLRRSTWLPNSCSVGKRQTEESVRSSGRDGKGSWVRNTTEHFRCSSHRQEHSTQQAEQFSVDDEKCSLSIPLERRPDIRRGTVWVTQIEKVGEMAVWDIAVEEDMSYYSAGVVQHNSQNIPTRSDKDFELHKDLVKSIKSNFSVTFGRIMLGSDFSAHEVRVSGIIAKDPEIGNAFRKANEAIRKYRLTPLHLIEKAAEVLAREGDIHIINVKFFFKKDVDKKHVLRDQIKAIVFGVLYGKMAKALARELGITVDEAQSLIDVMFEKWSNLKSWIDNVHETGKATCMIHYPNNRIRHLWAYLHDDIWVHHAMDRRGVNSPVQGFASDIGIASVYCYKDWVYRNITRKGKILDSKHTNIVHDAQYSDNLYEHMPFVTYLTEHSMSTLPMNYFKKKFDYELSIPLSYGMEFGRKWSALNEWNFRPEVLLDMFRDEGKNLEKSGKQIDKVIQDTKYMLKIRNKELERDPYTMLVNSNTIDRVFTDLNMFNMEIKHDLII